MSDQDQDEFEEAFQGFGEDEKPAETPSEDAPKDETPAGGEKPEEAPEEKPEKPVEDEKPEEGEKSKKDDEEKSEDKPSETPQDKKKPDEDDPVKPDAKPEEEAPAPLTKQDVESVVSNLLQTERGSAKEMETATEQVLEAYYPEGLSNTLTDTKGNELKTPQDVVDASGGQMTTEEASQWLMNEQYKLDQQVKEIKDNARQIAETTVKFKRDSTEVIQRYEPLFKAYPSLQQKVWDAYKPLIKADEAKNVILSAPDMAQFYDTMLEPYRLAFEHGKQQPATNPTPEPEKPEPAKPTAEDRMDVGGDGAPSEVNDPNDFAQQVTKELSR